MLLKVLLDFIFSIATAQVIDRVVLEVNRHPITQRQVYIHYVVKLMSNDLSAVKSGKRLPSVISKDLWYQMVDRLMKDRIVSAEMERMASKLAFVDSEKLENLKKDFGAKVNEFTSSSSEFSAIKVSIPELNEEIIDLIAVEAYIDSRQKFLRLTANSDKSAAGELRLNWFEQSWFKKLRETYPVRLYAKALDVISLK